MRIHPPSCARHCLGLLVVAGAGCGPSGTAPRLQPVTDVVAVVNQEVVLLLAASDRDGDELRYDFTAEVPDIDAPAIEGRAALIALPAGAVEFRWTPLAGDVGLWTFSFSVSDGSHDDTITVGIDVRSPVGQSTAPRFLLPQGTGVTLDLTAAACVDLDIAIEDADSAEVDLGQLEPLIGGAELTQTGGLTGGWRWCPSPEQIEADDRYSAVLSADDTDNPPTAHPYLVVLRRPIKLDCPGDAPVITHEPGDRSTLAAVALSAVIADDEGLKREPLLYYATTPPADPPDLSRMTQVTMRLTEGTMQSGTWRASVPNPVAGEPAGTSRPLYYLIAADDDDDREGTCDHLTQAPATETFSMTVTNPGGEGGGGLCEPCSQDDQCGGAADHCALVGGGSDGFCLQACESPADCPPDYTCPTAPIASVDDQIARQCVPVSSDCADPGATRCVDDALEDNDSPSQSADQPPLRPGDHDLVSCPAEVGAGDDEDWFDIAVAADARVSLDLRGGDTSDLDLALFTEDGVLVDASQSLRSDEAVSACLPAGIYLARVFAFSARRNPYSLALSQVPESCAPICVDDAREDDDRPDQARPEEVFPDPVVATDQSICRDDDDWYRIDLVNGERLVVDLTFAQANSRQDLDIHLYDVDENDLTPCSPDDVALCDLGNGQSADANEHFEFDAPPSGCPGSSPCDFYVVVRGFDGSENRYDIQIAVE